MSNDTFPTALHAFYHWEQVRANEVFLRARARPHAAGEVTWATWTWAEFGDQVRRCVTMLEEMLPVPGSRVAIMSRNCPHWFIADVAIQLAGHVAVPVFTTMRADNVKFIMDLTSTGFFFLGESENWDEVRGVLAPDIPVLAFPGTHEGEAGVGGWAEWVDVKAPAQGQPVPAADEMRSIIFTSGTTGEPKGVMYSLNTFRDMAALIINVHKGGAGTRMISYLPLAHAAERVFVETVALLVGGVVTFNHSAETFAEDMRATLPHVFFAVPRIWTKFQQGVLSRFPQEELDKRLADTARAEATRNQVRQALGLQDAHYTITASAPLSAAAHRWWESVGITLLELYGQTELIPLSIETPARRKTGMMGQAPDGVEIRIADNGEILGRGRPIMMGYYKRPELTAATVVDGWLHTGDTGEVDEDGYLRVTGRVKEIFKGAQGKYVAPTLVENVFGTHALVEQLCLMGSGLPRNVMVLVVAEGAGAGRSDEQIGEALRAHAGSANERLDPHERIGALLLTRTPWTIANSMLTATMKMRRSVLEKAYRAKAEEVTANAQRDRIEVLWLD